jgi:predicted hydrocarbon binding protein
MEARYGKENSYRDSNTVYYNYIQNSKGLKIEDGYCLCPLTEDGPAGLSPTYCICSTGYVKEMFERMMGESVEVELLESLRRGGKKCRFLIQI